MKRWRRGVAGAGGRRRGGRAGATAAGGAAVERLEGRQLLHAVVTTPIGDVNLATGQTATGVDLSAHFVNPDYTGTLVEFDSNAGSFVVQLTDSATPRTVANFLQYVNGQRYDGTIVHRSVPGFVIQGGGYSGAVKELPHVDTFAPVANEFSASRPDVRGTIAMAKLDGDPDSATSEWFVNLVDNTTRLGATNNGGFTTFGTVISGMNVVDAIAGLPTHTLTGSPTDPNNPFATVPVTGYGGGPVLLSNLVKFGRVSVLPTISYSAVSDNTAFVTAGVTGGALTLNVASAAAAGTAHVTVTATTLDGGTTGTTFVVRRADAAGPTVTAVAGGGDIQATLSPDHAGITFQVTYADDSLVKLSTLGDDDLTVTGPGGAPLSAALEFSTTTVDAAAVTATYKVTKPGGEAFTAADNGTYVVRANAGAVTDTSGNGDAAAAVGTFPVSISVPGGMPDLTAGSVASPASLVTPASKNAATVTIENQGSARAKGTATVVLYASVSGTLRDAVPIGTARLKLDVGTGLSKAYSVPFKSPTGLPEQNYHLLAAVNTTNTIKESDPTNNVLVSGATVVIQPPTVDLTAAFVGRLPGTITVGGSGGGGRKGRKQAVAVRVTNNGNVDARGVTTVRVLASADVAADAADAVLVTLAKKLTVRAGKSVVVKLKVPPPAAGTVAIGTPLHLGATVAFGGRPGETNVGDNAVFSSATVTFMV